MRLVRVAYGAGACGAVGLSWAVADRVAAAAFSHSHILGASGPAVPHVHGSSIALASVALLLASLATVLLAALLGPDRTSSRVVHGESPRVPAPGPAPAGVAAVGHATQGAALAGALGVTLTVTDSLLKAPVAGIPQLWVLILLATLQGSASYALLRLWRWCVCAAWCWARRLSPETSPLDTPARHGVLVTSDGSSGYDPTAARGRAPPTGRSVPVIPVGARHPTG
jgi:hypothetical protein